MPKIRWLDRARDDIKGKGLSRKKCTTVLHGGVDSMSSYIDATSN